ncbi:MAG: NAD-dependent epimerase/dehydratase family protein [Candidatus Levybacteria bacterium]|nr:NAD-dependent epimerase/dehydratase family protein [Candidatus Levybacteria bacterium]
MGLDYAVTVVDNLSKGSSQNLNPRSKFYNVDIRNSEQLYKVVKDVKPNVIFHLAA